MVIFHSYVSLPEGTSSDCAIGAANLGLQLSGLTFLRTAAPCQRHGSIQPLLPIVVDIPQHTADLRQKDVSLSNVLPRKHLSQEWPQGNLEENPAQLMPPRSPTFSMPCRCIVSRESVAKKWRVLLFCMWILPGRVICHS
jgi:hypothetical protein